MTSTISLWTGNIKEPPKPHCFCYFLYD